MKLLRNYAVAAVLCLAVTLSAACACIADENSQKVILDRDRAVLVLGSTDAALTQPATDISPAAARIVQAAKTAAGFAPPPINNIYWLSVNLRSLWSQTDTQSSRQAG